MTVRPTAQEAQPVRKSSTEGTICLRQLRCLGHRLQHTATGCAWVPWVRWRQEPTFNLQRVQSGDTGGKDPVNLLPARLSKSRLENGPKVNHEAGMLPER